MSNELTTPIKIEIPGIGTIESADLYLKSEVDKFIADLKESHKMEVEQLLMEIVELKEKLKINRDARKYWRKEYSIEHEEARHNKYKRCLAMAEWCNSEMGRETFACFRPRHTKEVWREEHEYWAKWRKIWFELYKKLKPNNSTAK